VVIYHSLSYREAFMRTSASTSRGLNQNANIYDQARSQG